MRGRRLVVGAKVHSVSIAPDDDDGPRRFGDTVIHWSRRRFAGKRLAVELCRVALAGPVAEMLYSGRPFHPGTVSEWSQDWLAALEAMNFIPERQRRMALLEQTTIDLYERFSDDFHWQAISAHCRAAAGARDSGRRIAAGCDWSVGGRSEQSVLTASGSSASSRAPDLRHRRGFA